MKRILNRQYFIGAIILLTVVGLTFLYGSPRSPLRRIANEIAYRLPFRVPGLAACPDCNIILVSLDTLRADELPCYGYSRDTAPLLCAFAKNNILFSRFYSQSSLTLDSHMSIFTGLYPSTHHVLNIIIDKLNPKIPTLTQVLQENDYRTMWAGITDDAELPLNKGFERGFSEIHTLFPQGPVWQGGYEKILPKLLDGKPTFLFLHTYAVHAPYLAGHGPRRYMNLPGSTIPLTWDEFWANNASFYAFVLSEFRVRLALSDTPESKNRNQTVINNLTRALSRGDLSAAQQVFWLFPNYEQYLFRILWYWKLANLQNPRTVPFVQSLYDERVNQLDDTLKPLLDFVSRPDVKRKTIVIFTSDHGEEFMEHGFLEHDWNLYKTSTHVPFIAAVPHMRPGVRDGLAQSIDIYPTLLQLVGIKPMGPLEGQSLV
ncbi:sulfatase, partial [Candidatus Gottesmanbacteria bacterium]|nr:sulfatase [Candidatus Gottesmanbacteria bacterium]